MNMSMSDKRLDIIAKKVFAGERLGFEDGVLLFNTHDLLGLGQLADYVRRKLHGNKGYYVYNQHLNYTNVCINHCRFCAYSREANEQGAFTLSIETVKEKLTSQIDEPIQEVHIVGGLNDSLPFSYYLDLLKAVREVRPQATIKAFTAVEIDYISKISNLSLDDTIVRLKEAGLSMIPGGGLEVTSDRVREKLYPKKIGYQRWLEVTKAVHLAGLTSNATLLYGHIETIEERVEHLIQLRSLQDETKGFSAFIPLAFHPENTEESHLSGTTAFDDLKTIAAARLMLDNFDHIKAYWVMIGEKLAQVALSFGADDLDGTIIEEKISHMAGATSAKGLTRRRMRHLISAAGFTPVERDSFYRPVTTGG
jgi:aminodeoxyfutalosine synthase